MLEIDTSNISNGFPETARAGGQNDGQELAIDSVAACSPRSSCRLARMEVHSWWKHCWNVMYFCIRIASSKLKSCVVLYSDVSDSWRVVALVADGSSSFFSTNRCCKSEDGESSGQSRGDEEEVDSVRLLRLEPIVLVLRGCTVGLFIATTRRVPCLSLYGGAAFIRMMLEGYETCNYGDPMLLCDGKCASCWLIHIRRGKSMHQGRITETVGKKQSGTARNKKRAKSFRSFHLSILRGFESPNTFDLKSQKVSREAYHGSSPSDSISRLEWVKANEKVIHNCRKAEIVTWNRVVVRDPCYSIGRERVIITYYTVTLVNDRNAVWLVPTVQ